MPRVPDGEYDELKAFLSFYSEHYMSLEILQPEMRPIACLEAIEKKSRTMARAGLRQAINDIIESVRPFGEKQIAQIDSELSARKLVTLSELRRRYSTDFARVVKRGKIGNETEYYLVRGIVVDEGTKVTSEERDALSEMMLQFEEAAVRKSTSPRRQSGKP
jgi:hypothetical protein